MVKLYVLKTDFSFSEYETCFSADWLIENKNVLAFWIVNFEERITMWNCLIEALSLVDDKNTISKIFALAKEWGCTDSDGFIYAHKINCIIIEKPTSFHIRRSKDKNEFYKMAGFGSSCLVAFSEFCRKLGYKGNKLLQKSFPMLVNE